MSALPPIADIDRACWDVRFIADRRHRAERIEQECEATYWPFGHRGPLSPRANLRLPRIWTRWSRVGSL
jgi:hypothetical protein